MTQDFNNVQEEAGKRRVRLFLVTARTITNLFDWSGRIVGAVCMLLIFAALFVNVILRYSVGDGIPWAYEIHAILLPWLVAGGAVIATAKNAQISVTLAFEYLPAAAHRSLAIAIHAAVAVVSIVVLESSQPILKASTFQTLSTLGVKQIWGYSSLVYAFGAIAVVSALNSMRLLLKDPTLEVVSGVKSLS